MEIRIQNLNKTFRSGDRDVVALKDVSLLLPGNAVTTLLGPSGCGKTTLLRCIAGLETPDSGEIAIGNKVVWAKNGRHTTFVSPDKRGIGMVFQSYAIWPHMTVFENLAYPLEARRLSRDEIRKRVREALRFVQLDELESRPSTALSGGQQQRVAMARALISEPDVILFDEPLSNLDAKLREEMRKELRRLLTQVGITSVYVTHDRFEALALSDFVVVMRSGTVMEKGTPREIYFRPKDRFVVDFLGGANFFEGTVTGFQDNYILVRSPIGTLACEATEDISEGQAVTVYIRVAFIKIPEQEPRLSPINRFRGKIETLIFLGESYEMEVIVGTVKLGMRASSTLAVREGEEIEFFIEPAGCRVLS